MGRNNVVPKNACPCCGAPVQPPRVLVSLDTNTVAYRGQAAVLTQQQAEFLFALVECYPRAATFDHLTARLWGADEPENPALSIRTVVSHLRRKLEPLRLDIQGLYGAGYRLKFLGSNVERKD